jgi:hypothetical protein
MAFAGNNFFPLPWQHDDSDAWGVIAGIGIWRFYRMDC